MTEKNTLIKKLMLIIISIIILAGMALIYVKKISPTITLPKPVIINTDNQPTMGNPNARLHLVIFEDLKCSNCARFNQTLFPIIKKNYIDTNKARYTVINLAFIDGSMPAATAARCIYHQDEKLFFPFVETIFAHQPPENENWATIPKLLDFASKIPGVNLETLATCLVENPYHQFFENNMKLASQVMNNAVATPTLYVNGVIVRPLTKERLDSIVNKLE